MDDRMPVDLFGGFSQVRLCVAPGFKWSCSVCWAARAIHPLPSSTSSLSAGRPLLVGIRPLQIWPLLLCKALMKAMAAFVSINESEQHKVKPWGWRGGAGAGTQTVRQESYDLKINWT